MSEMNRKEAFHNTAYSVQLPYIAGLFGFNNAKMSVFYFTVIRGRIEDKIKKYNVTFLLQSLENIFFLVFLCIESPTGRRR